MVLLHLVLDLLIQEAQFHHEDQTGHAGEPVPPHLQYVTVQHKAYLSGHLTINHDMPTPYNVYSFKYIVPS